MDSIATLYNETDHSFEMKSHYHNCYEVIYISSGKVRLKIGGKIYNAGQNSLIFISNFESHKLKVFEYPYKRYFILIQTGYLYKLLNQPVLLSIFKQRPGHFRHVIKLEKTESNFTENLFNKMVNESNNRRIFWEQASGAHFHLLLTELYRSHSEYFPVTVMNNTVKSIVEIQKYIEEYYMENLQLGKTASAFHMDMYYLSHQFKKLTGYTFKEYVILQRVAKAKDLLYNSGDSITDVGLNSGFNNVNHFIRIFKKYQGLTPLQYRKHLKNSLI